MDEIEPIATPIERINVTDQGHAGMTDIEAERFHLEALGYVVELAEVGKIYHRLLQQRASITFLCPEKIVQIERKVDYVDLQLEHFGHINATLLIAADGAQSICSQQIGLSLDEHDFAQTAVIANIGLDSPHAQRAFERFTACGPLALLPMSDDRMSLVWCTKPEKAQDLLLLDDDHFLQELQKQFGWRLGRLIKVGERASYPLVMRSRPQTVSHRFAVVGNAAQTLHPIAGQGFNLGIRDAVSLVESLLEIKMTTDEKFDIGCYAALAAYQQRRQSDRKLTMTMTAFLVHFFSNDWLPTKLVRNLGLMAMDTLPGLDTPLIQRTLGLVSR